MTGVAVAGGTPTTIGVVDGGAPLGLVLAWFAAAGLLLVGGVPADLLRWRATTYSLTADRLEITFSLLAHSKSPWPATASAASTSRRRRCTGRSASRCRA
ncbi:hypothetical protein [Amycolatopsis sp. FDAARGOS 1241]|uniref:hypothetical protein n=1 Tax=Amycolatopsis sp. FDAARGOS 1241 TaxID=2778070 RepID=UPI001EF2FDE4|nr:hypothetical protein [Amycolatopsis sp. FDAARGOS 1241]